MRPSTKQPKASIKQPKRRNAPRTRAEILRAATKAFSTHGYGQAGIRQIAALAGITSPMLLRYFGSKAGLFEAALSEALRADAVLEYERDRFGETLVRALLDSTADISAPLILALSAGDPEAREIAARAMGESMEPVAKWLGAPDAQVRAFKILVLAMGFVLCARVYPFTTNDKAAERKVTKWFAETVQSIVEQA